MADADCCQNQVPAPSDCGCMTQVITTYIPVPKTQCLSRIVSATGMYVIVIYI